MKLRYFEDKFGEIVTVLKPTGPRYRNLADMSVEELAQLAADVWTLPQPKLRQGETMNLLRLLLYLGNQRCGNGRFARLMSMAFMTSLQRGR